MKECSLGTSSGRVVARANTCTQSPASRMIATRVAALMCTSTYTGIDIAPLFAGGGSTARNPENGGRKRERRADFQLHRT